MSLRVNVSWVEWLDKLTIAIAAGLSSGVSYFPLKDKIKYTVFFLTARYGLPKRFTNKKH